MGVRVATILHVGIGKYGPTESAGEQRPRVETQHSELAERYRTGSTHPDPGRDRGPTGSIPGKAGRVTLHHPFSDPCARGATCSRRDTVGAGFFGFLTRLPRKA